MSIVIITIPGESKQSVVHRIQQETDGAIALVVVQTPQRRALTHSLRRFWRQPNRAAAIRDWLHLRVRPSLRRHLEVFRARTPTPEITNWTAPTYVTSDINNEETLRAVQACEPTVLAVWGSTLLRPELVATAPHSINLHLGCAPHYRGAIANQRAVEKRDWDHLGYTLHYINSQVDAGGILAQDCGTIHPGPSQTFTALNDAAETAFVETTAALERGETLPVRSQDITHGENILLRTWTPTMRLRVAKTLHEWDETGTLPS